MRAIVELTQYSVFTHLISSYLNLLNKRMDFLSGLVWNIKIAAVLLFWNTKCCRCDVM